MAVVSMKRNRFKVVFEDSQNTQFDLDYSLNDNLVITDFTIPVALDNVILS